MARLQELLRAMLVQDTGSSYPVLTMCAACAPPYNPSTATGSQCELEGSVDIHMCMHVCMYVCIYLCMYVCMCMLNIHIDVHMYAYIMHMRTIYYIRGCRLSVTVPGAAQDVRPDVVCGRLEHSGPCVVPDRRLERAWALRLSDV